MIYYMLLDLCRCVGTQICLFCVQLAIIIMSPCPYCSIILESQGMVAAACYGNDICQIVYLDGNLFVYLACITQLPAIVPAPRPYRTVIP